MAAYGDFSAGSFDHCEASRVEPVFISPASSAILSCAADAVQLQQSQTWTLRSRSNAGVTEALVSRLESVFRSLGSVFFQISASLPSLFMHLLWAEAAINSQLVKTPHFHHFSQ